MARISTYPRDTYVTGLDKWIGTDANTQNLATKNFTANAVADYFNRSAIIDTGSFSWTFAPYSNTQPQAEKSFQQIGHLDDTINILNLGDGLLRVSALTLANTTPETFIVNEWVDQSILVHVPSGPSQYAIYNVKSVTPDTEWFFLLELELVSGESASILKGESLVFGYWAGANMVTNITGTFPILVTGDREPVISIDVTTKNHWDTAYNRSLVSASVTGTTTKTLTLTEQSGATITTSWVDDNTDAVTSVFGRTGAIVAQSGDYTTTLVTEGTNLYFTTSRARLSVSAVTPLFYNNSTGEFTIQVANATQSGYLSSTDWNTFNSKQSNIAPGTTSQYWRGDKTWQNLTTTVVTEGTNLYFTDQRARSVISSSIPAITYDNTTGVFSLTSGYVIPTTTQEGNWTTAYNDSIVSASVTGTTTKTLTLTQQDGGTVTASWSDLNTDAVTSVFGRTGAVVALSGDYNTGLVPESGNLYYTDARARSSISLTTNGTNGESTYNSSTGVLNIPNYQSGVTSFNTRTGAITLTSLDVTDALGFTPENVANKSNDTALGTSAILYPTQNAVKTYVDSATAGGIILQGDWNAATNTPDITGTTRTGFSWRVSVAGNTNLGGITDWQVGDLAVKSATGWIKIDNTESVTSVFGRFGTVVAQSGDYNTDQVTEGSTNLYYTNARTIASVLTGYSPTTGAITSSDSILTAINKLSGNATGGYVPYTGATNNLLLGEYGLGSGYVQLDTTPSSPASEVGKIVWDTTYGTPSVGLVGGNVNLQIGQEEFILVHNGTGSALSLGQVVLVTGSTGELPSVSLASSASESLSAATLGVIAEPIANGADGFVTVSGIVHGLNTLAFTEGDLIWLGTTPGTFTTTKPTSPNHLVLIGYVIKKSGGNGSILVKIQNTQELAESSDVLISAPEVDGQGLFLQTVAGTQLWRNRSISDVLGYTPANAATTLTINGTTQDISTNRTWSVGTVTSVGLSLGTTGTDANISNSPITSTGSITLNLPTASSTNRGLLSSGDWTTFNSKQGTITLTTTGSSGAATFIGNTLNIPNYGSALSEYVPYTGATSAVNIGTNTFTAGYAIINGSGTNQAGVLSLFKGTSRSVQGNGYLNLYGEDGKVGFVDWITGNVRTFEFSLASLTAGATRVYTLPDTSGTIALTSNLSSYLPLSGGTLTGDLTINNGSADGGQLILASSGYSNWNLDNYSGSLRAYYNASVALSINSSLAATFTSDVIAGNGTSAVSLVINRGAAGDGNGLRFRTAGTNNWYIGSAATGTNTNLEIYNHNTATTNLLFNYSTGAATFSSSVTAGGDIISTGILRSNSSNTFLASQPSAANVAQYQSWLNSAGTRRGYFGYAASGDNTITLNNETGGNIILSGGNVGIGTTSPNTALDARTVGSTTYSAANISAYQGVYFSNQGNGGFANITLNTLDAAQGSNCTTAISAVSETSGTRNSAMTFATREHSTGNVVERMRITSGGNVGIGTTSPNSSLAISISAFSNAGLKSYTTDNVGGISAYVNNQDPYTGYLDIYATRSGDGGTLGGSVIRFLNQTTSTTASAIERMRITSGGNVGIGTSVISQNFSGYTHVDIGNATTGGILLFSNAGGTNYGYINGEAGGVNMRATVGNLTFNTGATERMRITSGGNVLIGTTSDNPVALNVAGIAFEGTYGSGKFSRNNNACIDGNRIGSDGELIRMYRGGTQVGNISVTGSSTSYNTSSDYRLKEDFKSINGLEIVNKIKVYDYKWKANDSRMDGVLAHELAEVLPYAVTGVKDGEQMQAVDYSKIVPVMVQAIKDLKAELDTLKNK